MWRCVLEHVVNAHSVCMRGYLHAGLPCHACPSSVNAGGWAASCYNVARKRHLVSETGRFLSLAQKDEHREENGASRSCRKAQADAGGCFSDASAGTSRSGPNQASRRLRWNTSASTHNSHTCIWSASWVTKAETSPRFSQLLTELASEAENSLRHLMMEGVFTD